jgi:Baseplate J-like protein
MSQYAKEITHILATLNEQGDEQDHALPNEEELDTIHVYPVEGGGMLFTRTPLEPEEAAPPVIDSQDDQATGGPITTKTPPPFVLFLLLLCVFVLFDLADTQLIAMMTPTVTVNIVPQTHTVTATANLPATAIRAHGFAPLTLSLSQTVSATGIGHQDDRHASGTLTFYNGLFSPQSIAQGTVFTGSDGIQVATDGSVTIPANTPPVDGQATIGAQTVLPGHNGNITAGDITTTIGNGVLVKNSQFSGGQDERTFAVVTHADIAQVVTQLTPRLLQSQQAALTSQLQANEALFSPTCTPTTNADHQPGDEATHVKVTVSETCIAGAYNQQAVNVYVPDQPASTHHAHCRTTQTPCAPVACNSARHPARHDCRHNR